MILTILAGVAVGQAMDARLMRFPDIHDDTVVFTYASDLWLVPAKGGIARRLTGDEGNEYIAKFSPNGQQIAFAATYDGNMDVYIMPAAGGEPKRLTYHNALDIPIDWMPDGKSILFRSTRNSPFGRYMSYYTVPAAGGTEEEHPVFEGGLGTISPDGNTVAYNRHATENAAWKNYRGGNQSFISFYDSAANKYWEMEHDRSAYLWPMWIGNTVYYANDSDGRYNLYGYDVRSKRSTKLTNFADLDIKWPSAGADKIIFERDAKLWTYDIASKQVANVPVMINSDLEARRPVHRELGQFVSDISISPSANRIAVEARGEMFSVPAKEGITYNITNTPGARERYVRWSPDGKTVLFASDKTGEYEWYVRPSDLSGTDRRLTTGGNNFYNDASWAPDSKSFIYTDSRNTLYIVDANTGVRTQIGPAEFPAYGDAVWSPDSKWLAYAKTDGAGFASIYLYEIATKKETRVGNGLFHDQNPVFDKEGKYLFFTSFRDWNPSMGMMELRFNFADGFRIYGYTLDSETPSPFAPKNDEEPAGEQPAQPEQQASKPLEIAGIDQRIFTLPLPAGNYVLIAAGGGKVYYASGQTVFIYDLAGKKSDPLIENVTHLSFTPKMDKFAYLAGSVAGIAPTQPGQRVGNGRVNFADVEATTDPQKEWAQSYWEAWRYERDYFWAPNMAGLDWKAIGDRYAKWLPYIAHRGDLDYLLRELLGELRTGHSYIQPAPLPGNPPVATGLLGADYDRTAQGVRFKKIYRGQGWFANLASPLGEPGLNIKEGNYLIAVDGRPVTPTTNVSELLIGKADKIVELTVSPVAGTTGRKVLVKPIGDETDLRYADWVNGRYEYVQEKTGGRVAYVYVPNTGMEGVSEFSKMFYPQVEKDAIIVDERYNGGGFIPDFFVETLGRTPLMYWTPRNMGDFRTPGQAISGPKVMLINYYAGSGGDAFPYYFRERGLGKLIGTRTWGGLVGIQGTKDLMAGGGVTVPGFASWDVVNGRPKWVVENEGVTPDITIDNTPDQVRAGKDPQLDKAIELIMEELRKNPPQKPTKPPYPGGGGG